MHSYWFSHSTTQHWLEGSWKVQEFVFTSPRCSAQCFTHTERPQCHCSPHVKSDCSNQYMVSSGSKAGFSHFRPCPKQSSLFTLWVSCILYPLLPSGADLKSPSSEAPQPVVAFGSHFLELYSVHSLLITKEKKKK